MRDLRHFQRRPAPDEALSTDFARELTEFVDRDVRPVANDLAANNRFPDALVERMRALGLFGLNVPRSLGGLGGGFTDVVHVFAELARGWLALPALLGTHLRVTRYLAMFGTARQRGHYLPRLVTGEWIASHAVSEAGTSDVSRMRTRVTPSADRLRLYGRKPWATNASQADIFAVVASGPAPISEPALGGCIVLLERGTHSFVVGEDIRRMGVHGVSLCPLIFDGCDLSFDDLLGDGTHDAATMLADAVTVTSLTYAARGVGVARASLEDALLFTSNPRGADPPLIELPVVRRHLASAATSLHAAELMLKGTAERTKGGGGSQELEALMCKVHCTTMSERVTRNMLSLYGGLGYAGSQMTERFVREAISLSVIGKPTDVSLARIAELLTQKSDDPGSSEGPGEENKP